MARLKWGHASKKNLRVDEMSLIPVLLSEALEENTAARVGSVPDMIANISKWAAAAKNARDRVRVRYGVRGYPGLWELIAGLEVAAQMAGGHFSFDSKTGKGALIPALEAFRAFLPKHRVDGIPAKFSRGMYSSFANALAFGRAAAEQQPSED